MARQYTGMIGRILVRLFILVNTRGKRLERVMIHSKQMIGARRERHAF